MKYRCRPQQNSQFSQYSHINTVSFGHYSIFIHINTHTHHNNPHFFTFYFIMRHILHTGMLTMFYTLHTTRTHTVHSDRVWVTSTVLLLPGHLFLFFNHFNSISIFYFVCLINNSTICIMVRCIV